MAIFRYWFSVAVIWGFKRHWPLGQAPAYLDSILLVGDQIDTGLHSGMGPFPQHILPQLVDIWDANGQVRAAALRPLAGPAPTAHSLTFEPAREAVSRPTALLFPAPLLGIRDVDWLAGGHVCRGRTDRVWPGGACRPQSPPLPPPPWYSPGRTSHCGLKSASPCWAGSKEKASSKGFCPCGGGACSGRLSRDAPVITPSQC